jgi:hypothetical protein
VRSALLLVAVLAAGCGASTGEAALAPAPGPVSVVFGGDVTLGSSYGEPPDAGWPLLAGVAGLLRAGSVAAVNLEGTFGPGGASKCAGSKSRDCFAFQAPAGNARSLARAGVDVVNHANNHAFDYGPRGWRSTRDALDSVGVRATGAPGEVALLRRNGTRIAFVGFSTYPWTAAMSSDADVRALVRVAAREADIVVAFMHAGAEGAGHAHVPHGHEHAFGEDRGDSRHFARVAIDAGADLVLGSGPHVLRGLELYRGRLIAYSLGNLAGWHNFNTGGRSGLSALLTVALAPDGRLFAARIASLRLVGAGVPRRGGGAVGLMRSLTRADFGGGGLRFARGGLIVPAR